MEMKKIISIIALLLTLTAAGAQAQGNNDGNGSGNMPFDMPEISAPAFPERSVSVTDFGAVGNGTTLCTQAFARAMERLAAEGGGHLIVPRGIWLTGPIVMRSNTDLHLERGAVILFSPDISLYPPVGTVFEGLNARRCQSPVSGMNLKNVAITGEGVIDGNGQRWRPLKRMKTTAGQWQELTAVSGVTVDGGNYWFPDAGVTDADEAARLKEAFGISTDDEWRNIRHHMRPVMVSLVSCRNVWLQGVTFRNSPSWNIHPLMCENVLIDNITVQNPEYAQNGDGLDLESCRNAVVRNSTFDVGDDGICIKSGKDADGRRRGRPCENVVIEGCTVFKGHGGFVIGSEMSGGVRNILARNCTFMGTDTGLRFKSTRGRGGTVERIFIDGIAMTGIKGDAVVFDLYYGNKARTTVNSRGETVPAPVAPAPVDETTPAFRDIHISNTTCTGAKRALFFNGIPEMPVRNITLENVGITAEQGARLVYSEDITLKNVSIRQSRGKRLETFFCKDITEKP